MNSPIFIVGLHRVGSTLWHNLIAMDSGVLRLTETRFLSTRKKDFAYFLETQVGDLSKDNNVERMVELCFSRETTPGLEGAFWRFKNMDVATSPELKNLVMERVKNSDRSLAAVSKAILEEITKLSGCERACVKFPVDVDFTSTLVEWYPNCRIVHIIRDPRALAMSKTNDPSGTAITVQKRPRLAPIIRKMAVVFVINQYRSTSRMHVKLRHLKNYRVFRYEDLLTEPEKVLRELCEFVGIEFSEAMLSPEKGQHEHQPSSLTGKRQKAFDKESATRWKEVISPLEDWLITKLTKRSMDRFGYDPEHHPVYAEVKPVKS